MISTKRAQAKNVSYSDKKLLYLILKLIPSIQKCLRIMKRMLFKSIYNSFSLLYTIWKVENGFITE